MSNNPTQLTLEEIQADPILRGMLRDKLDLTRENYVGRNWPEGIPEPWTAELEGDLPEKFQDWSQFDEDERPQV